MNEAFQIRLQRNVRTWPIDTFTAEGVVLNSKRDAFPPSVTASAPVPTRICRHGRYRIPLWNRVHHTGSSPHAATRLVDRQPIGCECSGSPCLDQCSFSDHGPIWPEIT